MSLIQVPPSDLSTDMIHYSVYLQLLPVLKKYQVSMREVEVACLVVRGMSNKVVANKLCIAEKTVKFHLTNVYKKLKIKSRVELIFFAQPHLKEMSMKDFQRTESPVHQSPEPSIDLPKANNNQGFSATYKEIK